MSTEQGSWKGQQRSKDVAVQSAGGTSLHRELFCIFLGSPNTHFVPKTAIMAQKLNISLQKLLLYAQICLSLSHSVILEG